LTFPPHRARQNGLDGSAAIGCTIERACSRDPRAARLTFAQLVHDHHSPTYARGARNTLRNSYGNLGAGIGQAGGREQRARRTVSAPPRLPRSRTTVDRRPGRAGPTGRPTRGRFARATIPAKRGVLRETLEIARVNGWMISIRLMRSLSHQYGSTSTTGRAQPSTRLSRQAT
jgi:hypothetical protein